MKRKGPTEREIKASTQSTFGGHLSELPKPHFRRFGPHRKEKRPVKVSVHRYYGIGQHYWVTLREEENPIWDAEIGGWRQCWDDDKSKGRIESEQFLSLTSATLWVRKMQKKDYPPSRYKLSTNVSCTNLVEDEEKVWFGHFKEGD